MRSSDRYRPEFQTLLRDAQLTAREWDDPDRVQASDYAHNELFKIWLNPKQRARLAAIQKRELLPFMRQLKGQQPRPKKRPTFRRTQHVAVHYAHRRRA
jgi:hypothetical protein